jgi:uncharacterized phiE125 gp8 family phage protein
MSSILLTPPAVEPVTLADAKAYLRVEHSDDDAVITALIAGARSHVEAQTRRALITQSWRLIRDSWPCDGRIAVAPSPLRQITAGRVYRLDGTTRALDLQAFVSDLGATPSIISFLSWSLPAPGRPVAGIEIDVEVGYGSGPANVPDPLRQAIKLLVSHWYENRGVIAVGQAVASFPIGVTALIAPYRVLSL